MKKHVLYTITITLSIIMWLVLCVLLIFASPRPTTLYVQPVEQLEAICTVIGVENNYITVYGLPMASSKHTSNVCFGEDWQYYPVGLMVDSLTALLIIGIPAVLMLRHLRKKYAIIAST